MRSKLEYKPDWSQQYAHQAGRSRSSSDAARGPKGLCGCRHKPVEADIVVSGASRSRLIQGNGMSMVDDVTACADGRSDLARVLV